MFQNIAWPRGTVAVIELVIVIALVAAHRELDPPGWWADAAAIVILLTVIWSIGLVTWLYRTGREPWR